MLKGKHGKTLREQYNANPANFKAWAKTIHHKEIWEKMNGDSLNEIVAIVLFDILVEYGFNAPPGEYAMRFARETLAKNADVKNPTEKAKRINEDFRALEHSTKGRLKEERDQMFACWLRFIQNYAKR